MELFVYSVGSSPYKQLQELTAVLRNTVLLCTALRACQVFANSFLCAEGEWMRQFRNEQKMSATQHTVTFIEHSQFVTINNHEILTELPVFFI